MYVKILDHDHNRAAVIYASDPGHPIHFGRQRIDVDPSQMTWEELVEALGVGTDSMDRTRIGSHPTAYYSEAQPYWEVGWVRFHKPGSDEVHMVAGTTPIYLLDESGKTIDRV